MVAIEGMAPKISPGSGKEIRFTATRFEGFDGPFRVEISNLPSGFSASSPVEIEAGQDSLPGIFDFDLQQAGLWVP